MRVPFFIALFAFSALSLFAADGEDSFKTRCALCHGGDGAGTDRARSILPTIHARRPDQLATIITKEVPSKGMPAFEMPAEERSLLIGHLKKLAANVSPAARDPRAPQPREGSLGWSAAVRSAASSSTTAALMRKSARLTERSICFGACFSATAMRIARLVQCRPRILTRQQIRKEV